LANKQRDAFLAKHKLENQQANISVNDTFPKFSFEHCFNASRSISKTDKKAKLAVIDKLITLSQMTWQAIKNLGKEQGFEKIPKSSFNSLPNVPAKFEKETKVVVFRLPKKLGRLIGYIEGNIFFVVWIDTKFDMYDH
jgi:hypothetical protein